MGSGIFVPFLSFGEKCTSQMVSLSRVFGFLSGGKLFFGSSLRWCLLLSWLVQGLPCRQCWCCRCAQEMLTSTKCGMSANDRAVPCSPHPPPAPPSPYFPWDFKSTQQSWIFSRPLSGTGAFLALPEVLRRVSRQMAVLPEQTEGFTKKGKIHLCQDIIFLWLGQGWGLKATGAIADSQLQGWGKVLDSLKSLFKSPRILDSKRSTASYLCLRKENYPKTLPKPTTLHCYLLIPLKGRTSCACQRKCGEPAPVHWPSTCEKH